MTEVGTAEHGAGAHGAGSRLGEPADADVVVHEPSGTRITRAQLEAGSARLARLLRARGIERGDHVAVLAENHPRYHEVCWAAHRAGLHYTPINWHLTVDEAGYIADDCGAKALVTTPALLAVAVEAARLAPRAALRLVLPDVDGTRLERLPEGWQHLDDAVATVDAGAPLEETEGAAMFYSSGTTGRPKGIKRALQGTPFGTPMSFELLLQGFYGVDADTRYLCPAPLYHAAPLGWTMAVQRIGGSVVVMDRFDPEAFLRLVEAHRITHVQVVPTMFVRLLKLREEVRSRYDLSSLRRVIHAAAPCPVEVKRSMLEWWGPIIHEYYAGSEGNGFCAVGPEEWLAHPGTVGRPLLGEVHIVGEDGEEVPAGATGLVYFGGGAPFEYHGDPAKTAAAHDARGWSTLGDVGHLDEDGYLYLTDRASFMIIAGGVNIYPQEIEDALAMHPAVADVAVIGVPDEDLGEAVKAVVELAPGHEPSDALAAELIARCADRLARYKLPRSVDFVDELPRLPTGKLRKGELRARYWPA